MKLMTSEHGFNQEDITNCSCVVTLLQWKQHALSDISRIKNGISGQKRAHLEGYESDKVVLLRRQEALRIQSALNQLIDLQLSILREEISGQD